MAADTAWLDRAPFALRRQGVDSDSERLALPYELRTEMSWHDFGTPTNPLGTPREFVQAMHASLVEGDASYLPDSQGLVFREAMGRFLRLPAEQVIAGASVPTLLRACLQAFEPSRVGVQMPCVPETVQAVEQAGHAWFPLLGPMSYAAPDMVAAIACARAAREASDGQGEAARGEDRRSPQGPDGASEGTRAFDGAVLANPSFPASRLLARSTLEEYLRSCSWVVVDESYLELSFCGESAIPLTREHRNLIVIGNLSATFCLPGVPMSFAVAHPDTAAYLRAYNSGSDLTMFSEVVSRLFSAAHPFLEQTHEFLDREIPWMQCMLSLIPGIHVFPAEANYVLCSFAPEPSMRLGASCLDELLIRLQLAGFLVRPATGMPGIGEEPLFCVAVRDHEENQLFLEALRSIINSVD